MDIGIVASRYAKALLRFSVINKEEQQVYGEMQQFYQTYQQLPQLSTALNNPTLSAERRKSLLLAATQIGKENKPTNSITKFIDLISTRRRSDLMPFIALSFLKRHDSLKGKTNARLSLAAPIDTQTEQRIKALVAQHANSSNVQLVTSIDSSLEAGFILEYDDYRLDASLRGQLERLGRQFKK